MLESVGHFFRVGCQLPSFLLMISFLFRTGIYLIYSPTQDIGYQWHFLRFIRIPYLKNVRILVTDDGILGWTRSTVNPTDFPGQHLFRSPWGPHGPRGNTPKRSASHWRSGFLPGVVPVAGCRFAPPFFSQLELVDW